MPRQATCGGRSSSDDPTRKPPSPSGWRLSGGVSSPRGTACDLIHANRALWLPGSVSRSTSISFITRVCVIHLPAPPYRPRGGPAPRLSVFSSAVILTVGSPNVTEDYPMKTTTHNATTSPRADQSCPVCGGSGNSESKCIACGGTGQRQGRPCSTCHGRRYSKCWKCDGTGRVR
jgi:hypothetical protein